MDSHSRKDIVREIQSYIAELGNTDSLKSIQGSVVLVRPQAPTKVEITQGKLRIADNGASYRYNIDADDSTIAEFTSLDTSNIGIDIVAKEAVVEAYVYDSGLK